MGVWGGEGRGDPFVSTTSEFHKWQVNVLPQLASCTYTDRAVMGIWWNENWVWAATIVYCCSRAALYTVMWVLLPGCTLYNPLELGIWWEGCVWLVITLFSLKKNIRISEHNHTTDKIISARLYFNFCCCLNEKLLHFNPRRVEQQYDVSHYVNSSVLLA